MSLCRTYRHVQYQSAFEVFVGVEHTRHGSSSCQKPSHSLPLVAMTQDFEEWEPHTRALEMLLP